MAEPSEVKPLRPIQTVYRRGNKIVRVNMATYANKAVLHCINHMQLNHYGATVAEVYDSTTGEPHAVITHSVVGKISIVFRREVKEGM